jgi:hypothetical protein
MTQRETVAQTVREQFQAVDTTVRTDLETWYRLQSSFVEVGFDLTQQGLRANLELLTTYRQFYQEGLKSWQRWLGIAGETATWPARSLYTLSNGVSKN